MALLSARSISAGYGDLVAIRDVSVEVEDGSLVGVVGPNGAGKSTLLRALAGVIPLRSGTVSWEGRQVNDLSADSRARLGIGTVQEGRRLFPSLSAAENLMLGAYHASKAERRRRRQEVLELFPALEPILERKARVLSGGEQQMVAIGRALMAKPRCILIDEPSLGLAPMIVDEIYHTLPVLRETGVGIVLVEQEVGRVLTIADRIVVLHEGHLMHEKPAQQFRDDPEELRVAYLGGEPARER